MPALTITYADCVAWYPDLARVALGTWTTIFEYLPNEVPADGSFPASQQNQLALQLAAHYGAMSLRGAMGATGPLASERVGGVGVTYGTLQGWTDALESTVPGLEFIRLQRVFGQTAAVL